MKAVVHAMMIGMIVSLASGQPAPTSAPAAGRAATAKETTAGKAPKPNSQQPQTQPARDARQILDARVPEVRFDGVPLEQVMQWLEDYTGIMVYVRWPVLDEVGICRDVPITVRAKNQTLSRIMWIIMNEAAGATGVKLAYEASEELLLLSTDKDLSSDMLVRIYDVRQIIQDIPNWEFPNSPGAPAVREKAKRAQVHRTPPPAQPSPGGGTGSAPSAPARTVTTEDEALQEFMELILNTIAPESWEINGLGGKGTIFPYKGKLLVRNSLLVHRMIAGLTEP